MNFSQALELLKQFKKIARPNHDEYFVLFPNFDGNKFNSDDMKIYKVKKADYSCVNMVSQETFSCKDIFADDWVEVKE